MDVTGNKSLRIWAVTDNKPGHRNQLQGLIDALGRNLPSARALELRWIEVPVAKSENIASLFKQNKLPENNNTPDIILCCGHRTHWQALYLRLCFGGKLIVMMRPSLPLSWFDLCVIPYHDGEIKRKNVIQTLGVLNKIRPAQPSEGRADKLKQGLILMGGPSRHYEWNDTDMLAQLRRLKTATADTHWTVTSSRRTPTSFETALHSLASEHFEFVPASSTNEHWLPAQFQQCDTAWVSEDSVSMVYESLSSGARVGLLTVPVKEENRITRGIDRLREGKWLSKLDDLEQADVSEAKPPLQEAERIAIQLLTSVSAKP